MWRNGQYTPEGVFTSTASNGYAWGFSGNRWDQTLNTVGINLSLANSIYGNSNTITPESLSARFFIKY